MIHYAGVLWAFVALFCWGFGDFLIQKTARAVGSWKAIFFIGVVGLIGLFPFVKHDLAFLRAADLLLLGFLGLVAIFTVLLDFEALRLGKIAIIEPIIGLELPIVVGLSIFLAHESLTLTQMFLVGVVFIGIMLAITVHHTHLHYHKRIFERGVVFAGISAIGMALMNFLVGVSSQGISPLVTIWFTHSLLAVVCGVYIFFRGELRSLISNLRNYPKTIIGQSILDNMAWVAFAMATTFIPIAIATAISETYIALTVILGISVNHEKLKAHQIAGVVLATLGVIALSYLIS